jgi:hypothetical protein
MTKFLIEHYGIALFIMPLSFFLLVASLAASHASIGSHRKKGTTSMTSYLIWLLSAGLLLADIYFTVKNILTDIHITDHVTLAEYAFVNITIGLFILFLWIVKLLTVFSRREYINTMYDPLGRPKR